MNPRQLYTLLNIAPNTLRRWAGKDYAEFMSPTGQGVRGASRAFSEQDARVLAWISVMKAQNVPSDEIYATLKVAQADNWRNLPPLPGGMANDEPIAVVPREAVEIRIRSIQDQYDLKLQVITKERDALQAQLEKTQREMDNLRHESGESLKNLQKELTDATRILQQRIAELAAKEAELRGELKQYTIAGSRRSAVTLVTVALLIGAVLMGAAILLILLVTSR